jgi:hypothetical protein
LENARYMERSPNFRHSLRPIYDDRARFVTDQLPTRGGPSTADELMQHANARGKTLDFNGLSAR